MSKQIRFPLYRKYKNEASYFKVLSAEEFHEIKKTPRGWISFDIKASILPDRNYIYDMIHDLGEYWVEISKEEYERIRKMSEA